MTCRQMDNDSISEEVGENSSNNMPNLMLWEDIHVLGDKPRRNKNKPQEALKQNRELATNTGMEEGSH